MTKRKRNNPARFVLIGDPALIENLHNIRQGREDSSLAKTAHDLLRERLRDLAAGDPFSRRQDGRRIGKAG